MVVKYTIYGERCSGTNYLEGLLKKNFQVDVTWDYGWKHWFGFNDLSDSDDTLFVGIVRDPHEWLNSFYKSPHHVAPVILPHHHLRPFFVKALNYLHNANVDRFLNHEFWSTTHDDPAKTEQMHDRNIFTKQRYKNVFELRYTKLRFLVEEMPKKVKHYILIRYEDLLFDLRGTLEKIRIAGDLKIRTDIAPSYPLNVKEYKAIPNAEEYRKKNCYPIPKHKIMNKLNSKYERQLGYM